MINFTEYNIIYGKQIKFSHTLLSNSAWGSPKLIGILKPAGSSESSNFNNSSSVISFGAGNW